MEYASKLTTLTPEFYSRYPNASYPEILKKASRPYKCMLLETHEGYFVCLPFRTHVSHKYAFHFRGNADSLKNKSGIDFSKMIIIEDCSYISDADAIVRQQEYNEMMANIETIVSKADEYLTGYLNHIRGDHPLAQKEFERIYGNSCLPYFHKELGLPLDNSNSAA